MSPNTKLKGGDVFMTRLQTITSLSLLTLGLFNRRAGLRMALIADSEVLFSTHAIQ